MVKYISHSLHRRPSAKRSSRKLWKRKVFTWFSSTLVHKIKLYLMTRQTLSPVVSLLIPENHASKMFTYFMVAEK